jgi:hypothetical protein
MDSFFFYINILINSAKFIKAFINNDCLCYAAFNEFIVRALKLPRIPISYKFLKLAEEDMEERKISFITYANVDIDEYKERIFGYVIKMLDSKGYHNPVIAIGCLYVRTVWGCESIMN